MWIVPIRLDVDDLGARVLGGSVGVHDERNNETVKTQDFCENEDKNHTDEETWLLCGTTDTGVTDNSDSETSCETGETDSETCAELDETGVEGHWGCQSTSDKDGDDETVLGCQLCCGT